MSFPNASFGIAGLAASFAPIIIALIVWTLIWKGMALWRAAKLDNKIWFVILLVVNTVGILEIIYLFAISKKPAAPLPTPTNH